MRCILQNIATEKQSAKMKSINEYRKLKRNKNENEIWGEELGMKWRKEAKGEEYGEFGKKSKIFEF